MSKVIQKISYGPKKLGEIMERRRWILPSVLSVVLFVVAIWGVESFNQLLLYDDEFGYWTASAYLTGTDWKSVTSGIPYYSYGYGFLILTPIRLLFSEPSVMYQAAIVANALLLVASYWIARNVSHQLFEDAHWALIDVVCFVVMLYPSNIVFSHIAWAECTLVFVFWVFVWLSLRVIKKPSLLNHIGLAAVVMGLYVVHQRTIAVAIATVMIMAWCFWVDKSRRKNIIWFAVMMVVLIVVHTAIKNDLINDYYYNNAKVKINNFDGQADKMLVVFDSEGLAKLCTSIIGKAFYLMVSTLMMGCWGFECMIKDVFVYFRQIKTNIKKRFMEELTSTHKIWYVWLLLAFVGCFLISALFLIDINRNDILLYGRYVEYMLGVYCIIGIMSFLKDEKWYSRTFIYALVIFVVAWFCQGVLDEHGLTSYQAYHSIGTSLFMEKGGVIDGAVLDFAFCGLAFSIFIVILLKFVQWKNADIVKKISVVVMVAVLFCYISFEMVFGVMTEKQLLRIVNIQNIVGWVEQVDGDESQNVYFCSDTESRYWSESFQFLLGDNPLTVIETSQINLQEDAFYIVGNGYLQAEGFDDVFYCIKESNQFALIVSKDGKLAEEARELKGE